jgi:hypothetical protein
MDQDFVFGAALVAVFVAFAIVLGYFITRFQQARYARAWKPLLDLVDGAVQPSSGGGADSPMRGTYKGYQIIGSIAPGASKGEDSRYNHFMVGITALPGARDWRLAYVHRLWPLGSASSWRIESKDEALRGRLEAAEVAGIIEQLGILPEAPDPPVSYSATGRSLLIQCDAGPDWIPSREYFVQLLETLIVLAKINAAVNPANV